MATSASRICGFGGAKVGDLGVGEVTAYGQIVFAGADDALNAAQELNGGVRALMA